MSLESLLRGSSSPAAKKRNQIVEEAEDQITESVKDAPDAVLDDRDAKFFDHVFKEAQKKRTLARLAEIEEFELQKKVWASKLPGLLNKKAFDVWAQEIDLLVKRGTLKDVGIIFGDLNHFKEVNDTLGHDAGDRILEDAAKALKSAVRETDLVFRVGGDEFVILMISNSGVDSKGLENVMQRVFAKMAELHSQDKEEVKKAVTFSLGGAILNSKNGFERGENQGKDRFVAKELADAATYFAKKKSHQREGCPHAGAIFTGFDGDGKPTFQEITCPNS